MEGALSAVIRLLLQFFCKIADLVQYELFFQKLVFLSVEPFLQNTYFGIKRSLVWILATKIPPSITVSRIFKLIRQLPLFLCFNFNLFLELQHFFGQLGHNQNFITCNLYLSFCLCDLNIDHPHIVLQRFDSHFCFS